MRAIVLKNHYEPTASLAYIVRKEVPGIEVFGGISLDLTVGGVNPAAVEWMTKVKGGYGKVVWLPTFDSEAQVNARASSGRLPACERWKGPPEVAQVIAIAAEITSCSKPDIPWQASLLIIEEAKRQGVQHVMVTHALTNPGGPLSLAESSKPRSWAHISNWSMAGLPKTAAQERRSDPRRRSVLRGPVNRLRPARQSAPS